jgi:hypothetical protein
MILFRKGHSLKIPELIDDLLLPLLRGSSCPFNHQMPRPRALPPGMAGDLWFIFCDKESGRGEGTSLPRGLRVYGTLRVWRYTQWLCWETICRHIPCSL